MYWTQSSEIFSVEVTWMPSSPLRFYHLDLSLGFSWSVYMWLRLECHYQYISLYVINLVHDPVHDPVHCVCPWIHNNLVWWAEPQLWVTPYNNMPHDSRNFSGEDCRVTQTFTTLGYRPLPCLPLESVSFAEHDWLLLWFDLVFFPRILVSAIFSLVIDSMTKILCPIFVTHFLFDHTFMTMSHFIMTG